MAGDESNLQPIFACLGHPVGGNPTQFMMERTFAHHDLDWRYLTLDIKPDDLQAAIRGIRVMGFRGANITQPHKREVLNYLDQLSDAARLIGAVNCIRREGDELIGENTDGQGFVQALREAGFDPSGKSVVILGAGGAARAIAVTLAQAGCRRIEIVNRTRERGEDLVQLLNEHFSQTPQVPPADAPKDAVDGTVDDADVGVAADAGETPVSTASDAVGDDLAEKVQEESSSNDQDLDASPFATFFEWTDEYDIPSGTDLLVNATSIGLFEPQTLVPIAVDTLEGVSFVADVIFNPTETRLLDEAKSHGCQTLGGLPMLVQQGAIAFELWSGQQPAIEVMQDALEEFFGV